MPRSASRTSSLDQLQPIGIDQIDLGQRDHAGVDLEQIENGQMLARLRHHAFVGGDDEQRRVDAAHARQHVLDEVDVAGHVHDADRFAARQREPRKAEIDRHLALAFFFEPIGMSAGEGLHQRRFAVIDVAGGADDAHDLS